MMIQGTSFVTSSQAISSASRASASQPAAQASSLAEVDQLDISPAADLASRSADTAAVRQERVAQIRAAIEAGTYETDDKVSLAVDRLLDRMG